MRRLLTYLRPYRWQVAVAIVVDHSQIFLRRARALPGESRGRPLSRARQGHALGPVELAQPAPAARASRRFPQSISALLVFTFVFEFLQTYFMQWTGQKVMFDLRSQIFRHLQRMHVAFYDKNPVGRLVTRVTTDVDALNEMFTSGVVSIFEDLFVLVGILGIMLCMNWKLALITFAVLPLIVVATKIFRDKVRDSYRRIRTAIARINSYLQEHVSGMVVLQLFNRERKAYQRFSEINRSHMDAYKDAILAYSALLSGGRFFLGDRDRLRHLVRRPGRHARQSSRRASRSSSTNGHLVSFIWSPTAASLGVLIAFTQYAQRFFRPIMDFSEKYNILQSAMAASERIFKLLDTPVDIVSPAVTKKPEGPGRIEFDHVWFAYRDMPEAERCPCGDGRLRPSGRANLGGAFARRRHDPRLGPPRRNLHHRTRRNRRRSRPHRRRQDHADLPAAALLRRPERRSPHRRRRRQRNGPRRPAQPLRRRPARSVPVHRHDRRQHPPGHRRAFRTRMSPRPPKT